MHSVIEPLLLSTNLTEDELHLGNRTVDISQRTYNRGRFAFWHRTVVTLNEPNRGQGTFSTSNC